MRKARRGTKAQIDQLSQALLLNGEAIKSDRPKSLTHHDLRTIRPMTDNQALAFDAFEDYDHVVLNGSPGSGKSFLSSYHALKSLLVTKEQTHIKIIRSAVECRSQGFLPGDLAEKSAPYENPYHGIFHELLGRATAYEHLKKSGQLSFETTGFLRGLTFINTFIIVDEAANLTLHEIDTIMTRIGDNSRIVFCGDIKQSDLKKNESGYLKALRIWDAMDEFSTVTFSHDDIVRSGVVKSWIIASENIS